MLLGTSGIFRIVRVSPRQIVLLVASVLGLPNPLWAVDFSKVIRQVGKVSDEVPLNRIDDVVQDAATARAGRDLLENVGVRLDDPVDRTRGLRKAWKEALGEADPNLLKQIDQLDQTTQEAALVLIRGANRVESTIPDIAIRSNFLTDAGGDTLAAIGRYDDLMDDALRFNLALRAGSLPTPTGLRAVTLNDFGKFFQQQPSRARHFWTTYVRPHWKAWLGGTALTAVIVTPDEYLDEAGNVIKDKIKKLIGFGGTVIGDILGGAGEGAGEGLAEILRKSFYGIMTGFFSSGWGIVAFVLLSGIMIFSVPFTRKLVFGLFALIRNRPQQ